VEFIKWTLDVPDGNKDGNNFIACGGFWLLKHPLDAPSLGLQKDTHIDYVMLHFHW
jgi:hypothetical protein